MPPVGVPAPEGPDAQARLSPEMASFRALVLAFVRAYIAEWGQSPSFGEIAAGTNSNRTRVKRAVVSLERAGLLVRTPGPRGLSMPDAVAQARLTLIRAGVLDPVTNQTLLPAATLDYPAGRDRVKRGKRRNGASGSARDRPQPAER